MYKIAVVGATGNVGREMVKILAERNFPASEVIGLASAASLGTKISFGDDILEIKSLKDFDFFNTDFILASAGSEISETYAEKMLAGGAILIDNASFFRMDDRVPLVIPEVNGETIAQYKNKNIIANPNCCVVMLLMPLKPLHDKFNIKRIVVSTYQSVSGKGKHAIDELYNQTKKVYEADRYPAKVFPKNIAFNCIPQVDAIMDDGNTKEEIKIIQETQKILSQDIKVSAHCVRVPVFNCHAESVNVEFHSPFEMEEVEEILYDTEGVVLFDRKNDGGYKTQVECSQEDAVFVSRLRRDESVENGLNLWIVSDNIRKGAALNAVQILEKLVAEYLPQVS